MTYALVNKYWRGVSREEFWHKLSADDIAIAIAFIPEDQRKLVFETAPRKAFEVY